MGIDMIFVTGAFISICAYFSYRSGEKDGYQQMAREVASSIVEIHMEQQKIEVMIPRLAIMFTMDRSAFSGLARHQKSGGTTHKIS